VGFAIWVGRAVVAVDFDDCFVGGHAGRDLSITRLGDQDLLDNAAASPLIGALGFAPAIQAYRR
jgi:hypothetical protein